MIQLTVGLPMFNCKYIGWLALEGLCRQKNINFDWELVIAEEVNENYHPMGIEKINEFKDRLDLAGCKQIKYIPLNTKISISKKWKLLGQESDKESKYFLTQGADDFPYPQRLQETFDILNSGFDYVSSQVGIFYNIYTEFTIVYNRTKEPHTTGLNNGFKIDYIKNLEDENKEKNIDTWLVRNMIRLNKDFKFRHNNNDTNLFGMFTTGLNNVSKNRASNMKKNISVYNEIVDIKKFISIDILNKLNECKPFCKIGFY